MTITVQQFWSQIRLLPLLDKDYWGFALCLLLKKKIFFLLLLKQYSLLCMDIEWSPSDLTEISSFLSATLNSAFRSIHVYISVWTCVFNSLMYVPQSTTAASCVNSVSLRNVTVFSTVVARLSKPMPTLVVCFLSLPPSACGIACVFTCMSLRGIR